jgi:hypothetical protein
MIDTPKSVLAEPRTTGRLGRDPWLQLFFNLNRNVPGDHAAGIGKVCASSRRLL